MPPDSSSMQGFDADLVARALRDGDPLPGASGFAGTLPDGRAVRDVLGRYPLFTEKDDHTTVSPDPIALDAPVRVPAGTVRSATGDKRVWSLPEPELYNDKIEASTAVKNAIQGRSSGLTGDKTAIAFSGGVDSAVIAALAPSAPLYVAGFPGSPDIVAARETARLCGRFANLSIVELDSWSVRLLAIEAARATGRTNEMDLAIAVPLMAVAYRASADGYEHLAVGQGADELFGGYEKVAEAPTDSRVNADTVRGAARELITEVSAEMERDVLALRAAGIEPVAPFCHDRVVEEALRLPDRLLVNRRGQRKVTLRRAVRDLLPDRVVFREKRAIQYGSSVAREVSRLSESELLARISD